MLSFVVFQDGLARRWPVDEAYLFGPDEVPVPAEIRLDLPAAADAGLLACVKQTTDASGLAIPFPVADPDASEQADQPRSLVTLRTCLLPARDKPYLLSLELARQRIMLFLNKLEDWGLFDLPADHPIMARFEEARRTFTEALVHQRSPDPGSRQGPAGFTLDVDRLARRALDLAVDAGDALALLDVERQLPRRLSGEMFEEATEYARRVGIPLSSSVPAKIPDTLGVRIADRPSVGVIVDPARFDEPCQQAVQTAGEFITVPMRWIDMEPTEGRYSFTHTDRWIEWAVRSAKIPVVGGPLLEFSGSSVPDWLYIWENDYDTLRELVYEHVRHIVTRYRRTVTRWIVASGLHINENISLKFEQLMDLSRLSVLMVRKLHPTAKVQIEITHPWGEYHAKGGRSLPPLLYAEMLNQAGIGADALGLRIVFGSGSDACHARDLMVLSDLLDRYASFDKPIALSAVGAPARPDQDAGYWRAPWSEPTQAEWARRMIEVAASKPYVQSISWHQLTDSTRKGETPNTGLVGPSGELRAAVASIGDARDRLASEAEALEST